MENYSLRGEKKETQDTQEAVSTSPLPSDFISHPDTEAKQKAPKKSGTRGEMASGLF